MREDAGDGGRFLNGRDELQLPAAVRAALDVDIEHAVYGVNPAQRSLHALDMGGNIL